jgi:hypothetical protein
MKTVQKRFAYNRFNPLFTALVTVFLFSLTPVTVLSMSNLPNAYDSSVGAIIAVVAVVVTTVLVAVMAASVKFVSMATSEERFLQSFTGVKSVAKDIKKTAAIGIVLVILLGVSTLQVAVCTQESPDWVYVTTITGNKSQDINIDALVSSQYHWGVRSSYTATGDTTFELKYGDQNRQIFSSAGTYILDFDPDRNRTRYGSGPLKVVTAPNVENFTLNIYYDANFVDPSPTASPSPSPPSSPAFPTYAIIVPIAAIVVAVIISLVYIKAQKRKWTQRQPQLPKEAKANTKFEKQG